MSGLIVAAFLCHFLGFVGPFAAVGILSLLLTLFLDKVVDFVDTDQGSPSERAIELSVAIYSTPESVGPRLSSITQELQPTYGKVLETRRQVFGLLSLIFGMMLWTKIDTTMADKLYDDFDFSPELCALFYTIQFIGFLCVSPFCHKIMHHVDNTLLISVSQILQGVASLLIGPSHLLGLPNSLAVIVSGLFLTGIANTFTTISTYKEMHDPYIERYGKPSAANSEKLSDILSGLYNAGFSSGVIIGPFLASYITLWL